MAYTPEQKLQVARERAFSKILWGERDVEVYRFLTKEGFADDVIETILDEAHRERSVKIRKRSVRNIIFGSIGMVACGGVVAVIFLYSRVIPVYIMVACAVGFFTCLVFTLKAVIALFSGKSLGSALMD